MDSFLMEFNLFQMREPVSPAATLRWRYISFFSIRQIHLICSTRVQTGRKQCAASARQLVEEQRAEWSYLFSLFMRGDELWLGFPCLPQHPQCRLTNCSLKETYHSSPVLFPLVCCIVFFLSHRKHCKLLQSGPYLISLHLYLKSTSQSK